MSKHTYFTVHNYTHSPIRQTSITTTLPPINSTNALINKSQRSISTNPDYKRKLNISEFGSYVPQNLYFFILHVIYSIELIIVIMGKRKIVLIIFIKREPFPQYRSLLWKIIMIPHIENMNCS